MSNVNVKDLVLRGESKIFNIELIGIKAVGDYSKFVDVVYVPFSGMYNPKNEKLSTSKEYYLNLLNEGKCIQVNSTLVFTPNKGYEKKYLEYVESYLEEKNKKELFKSLKDVSSYPMVNAFLKMIKEGTLSKESTINKIKKYFKEEEMVFNYI